MRHRQLSFELFLKIRDDFLVMWRELFLFDVCFQVARAWVLSPLIAVLLSWLLLRSGRVAVSNQDIIAFVLTPWGLLYLALLTALTAFLLLIEQSGLLLVISSRTRNRNDSKSPFSLKDLVRVIGNIGRLGTMKVLLLTFLTTPFVAIAVLVYFILLTHYDIYYYLTAQPVSFWIAVGIGSILLLAFALLGIFLLVNWSLALPVLLFENMPAGTALSTSHQRIRNIFPTAAFVLLSVLGGLAALGGIAAMIFRSLATSILIQFGIESLIPFGILLLIQAVLFAIGSFLTNAGIALAVNCLYRQSCPSAREPEFDDDLHSIGSTWSRDWWGRQFLWPVMLVLALSPLPLWGTVAERALTRTKVQVTAHRGLAREFPENTLIAIKAAIEAGADYVEIDVHQTQDGIVVLLHDRDLRRVAGDSRRLAEISFEDARQLDVGSWFDPRFSDVRIPTLEEAIDLCRGKVHLNIEIKVFGPVESVASAVAKAVRNAGFESDCIVTSLNLNVLQAIRNHAPNVPVGLIIGQSIGDVRSLNLDAISVRADHLSDTMIQAAHEQGRQVMVWGINSRQQMIRQLQRGVDNLIVSDPAEAIRTRDVWQEASDLERIRIASRLLLGLSPQ